MHGSGKRFRQIGLVVLVVLIPAFGAFSANAQTGKTRLTRPCAATTTKSVIEIERDGDVSILPCPGRSVVASGLSSGATVNSLTISANQNNYAVGTDIYVRLDNSSGGTLTITGIDASQTDETVRWLVNKGTSSILLSGQDTGSLAANRFLDSVLLNPKGKVLLIYNGTRWEIFD